MLRRCSILVARRSLIPPLRRACRACTSSALAPRPAPVDERHALTRRITEALAPADHPEPELPDKEVRDLDALYDTLMAPLPAPPTREQRHDKLHALDTSPEVFWRQREPSEDSFDLLIRACGMQGELAKAHAAFDAMSEAGVPVSHRTFSALMDACARAGDVPAAKAVLKRMEVTGLEIPAPMVTGLIGAIRRAGRPAHEAHAVLRRARKLGVVEDCPLHTAIIQAYLDQRELDAAWQVFNEMRTAAGMVAVKPDAVAFTAMLTACAMQDRLEQAHALLRDMELDEVEPTLATHAAYIRACAARCESLAALPRAKRREMRALGVDADPLGPLRLAEQRVAGLLERGLAPDAHVYRALLLACSGACDATRADAHARRQRAADGGALRGAAQGVRARAAARPHHRRRRRRARGLPARRALGAALDARPRAARQGTLDHVLGAFTAGRRVHRALALVHTLYAEHGLAPGEGAFRRLLGMSVRRRSAALAARVLAMMDELGVPATARARAVPQRIDRARAAYLAARERRRLAPPSFYAVGQRAPRHQPPQLQPQWPRAPPAWERPRLPALAEPSGSGRSREREPRVAK